MFKPLLTTSLFLAAFSASAASSEPTDRGPSLSLSASATESVTLDQMVVVVSAEKDGPSVGPLNATVLRELGWAVAEAKRVDGIETATGNLATHQIWGPNGRAGGWKVRGEVILRSRNTKELGDLAGKLGERLQLNGVSFQLSREARESAESRLIQQATAAFSAKAQTTTKALGFASYELKNVQLSSGWNDASPAPMPRMMAMAAADGMAKAEAVPSEPGKTEVRVSISGSVLLAR